MIHDKITRGAVTVLQTKHRGHVYIGLQRELWCQDSCSAGRGGNVVSPMSHDRSLSRFADMPLKKRWCFVQLLLENRRQHPEGDPAQVPVRLLKQWGEMKSNTPISTSPSLSSSSSVSAPLGLVCISVLPSLFTGLKKNKQLRLKQKPPHLRSRRRQGLDPGEQKPGSQRQQRGVLRVGTSVQLRVVWGQKQLSSYSYSLGTVYFL